MTARASDIAARMDRATAALQYAFAELAIVEPHAPREVASIVAFVVAHLRSLHPEAVAPTGALGAPGASAQESTP